jgi:OPA family hexose phosphate transport protein UhpT-like MFS transporter
MQILKQRRLETLSLPVAERKKRWFVPFLKSYLVVFLGYMAMYLIRKNFTVSQNDLIDQYGFTKTELGKIGFWFSMVYGVGKTVVGYFGDGRETKNFVSLLLILSSLAMFGFGSVVGSLNGMILLFALNGLFQSAGAPFSYSTITNWTAQKHRGRFLALWNISHNLGGALAAVVATFGAQHVFNGDIRGMFFFPAAIALVIGLLGLCFGADSPEAYGLGRTEEIFEEKVSVIQKEYEQDRPNQWQTFKRYILKNPFIWGLCLSNVFLYIICIGVDQWGLIYAREVLGFSKEIATKGFTMFQIGAFVGAFIWGYLSDVTRGRSSLLSLIAMGLTFIFLRIYQTAPTENIYLTAMFVLGFLIFGPQLLIGVSGVFFVPKNAVSVADGFRGTFGYLLGDSFAKLGMGMMADNKVVFGLQGWD